MDSNTQTVSTEEALALLSDGRRRQVLRHLIGTGGSAVELTGLIDGITSGEPRVEGEYGPAAHRVRTRLHHVHLPKLAEAGIVEYDPQSATVRYHRSVRIERLLSVVADERGEWTV